MSNVNSSGRRSALSPTRWLGAARRTLTRRQLLEAIAVTGLAGFVSSIAPAAPRRRNPADLAAFLPRLREMKNELHAAARSWAVGGAKGIARPDGYVFAVELAQLMGYFAHVRDREPYQALRDFAARHLIVDIKDYPFAKGFVLWRCKAEQDEQPDASGTTEALRMAKALWTGANSFGLVEDRELALTVLDGYARHAKFDQGLWLIRNYFHFRTRSFASNSFIIDYDADFVREVADALKGADPKRHAEYSDLADKSYEVMKGAVAPCGLLYDLLQPELKTMYHNVQVAYFSPNDVIQSNNSCATASTVARGLPNVARGVLNFLLDPQKRKVHAHYYGRDGKPVQDLGVGATEYGAMARLAALLGDKEAVVHFTEIGLPYWERVASTPNPKDAWTTSEMLIALQAVIEAEGT